MSDNPDGLILDLTEALTDRDRLLAALRGLVAASLAVLESPGEAIERRRLCAATMAAEAALRDFDERR